MIDRDTKILGFIAVAPDNASVICDGDSCVVAGSEQKLKQYIAAFTPDAQKAHRIIKARYGHVLQAMRLGGVYSFDEEAYLRFRPLVSYPKINTNML